MGDVTGGVAPAAGGAVPPTTGGSKGKGGYSKTCLACCGCAALVGLAAVVVVVGGIIYINKLVSGAISDTPLAVEQVEYTDGDVTALQLKRDAYKEAVDRGESPTLVLDEKELNVLVLAAAAEQKEKDPNSESALEAFRLSVLPDDSIDLKLSLKTGPGATGKPQYLNVQALGNVTVANGEWKVSFKSCTLGITAVPKFLLSAVEQAIMEKSSNNPDFEKMKSAVTKFRVSGGKIELQLNPEVINELKKQAGDAKDAAEPGEQGLSTREMEIYKYVLDRIETHTNAGKSAEEGEKAAIADAATKFAVTEDEAAQAYRKAKKVSETLEE